MSIQELLTSNAWEVEDGKKMLFTNERYFVFEEDDTLFDGGRIEYDETSQEIRLQNSDAKGSLSVKKEKKNVSIEGVLYSKMAGVLSMKTQLKSLKKSVQIPHCDTIQEAAFYSDLNAVKIFLKEGIDVNSQDKRGDTALIQASNPVSFEVIDFLLKKRADLNVVNSEGQNALHGAIAASNEKLIKLLLDKGVKTDFFEGENHLLFFAIKEGASLDIIKSLLRLLKKDKAFMKSLNDNAFGILESAMYDFSKGFFDAVENVELFELILKTGIDLEQKEPYRGHTIFLSALSNGVIKITKLLIKYKADIYATDEHHKTALDLICSISELENESLKKEFEELFKKEGITQTKEDLLKEKVSQIKILAQEGDSSKAIEELKELEDEIGKKIYFETSIEILLSPKNPSLEQLKKAYDFKDKSYTYEYISIKDLLEFSKDILVDLAHKLPKKSDAYEMNQAWAEHELLDKIGRYIEKDASDETLLNKLLKIVEKEGKGIPLDQFEPEDHRTPYINLANERALAIYDKLIEIEAIKYLDAKARFLIKIKQRWMDEHFECHNKMLSLDFDNELTIKLGDDLREEFDIRHPKESSLSTYPVCPVPMENAFEKSVESYKGTKYKSTNEWYFKYILSDGIGKKRTEDESQKQIKPEKSLDTFHDNIEEFDKLFDVYSQNKDKFVLDAIAHFFKAQTPSLDLSSEIRIFFRKLEHLKLSQEELEGFASTIRDPMRDSFALEENSSVVQDCYKLLYIYAIPATYLPTASQCVEKLFDNDSSEQEKYASYLLWIQQSEDKEIEVKVLQRLNQAYGEKYVQWRFSVLSYYPDDLEPMQTSGRLQCMLIEILGNIESQDQEVHLLLLYALSSFERGVKDSAITALKKIACASLEAMQLSFDKLQEDFARAAVMDILEFYQLCPEMVIDFLDTIHTEDAYLKGRIDDVKRSFF